MTNRKSRLEWIEHLHSIRIPILLSILLSMCPAPARSEVGNWIIVLNLMVLVHNTRMIKTELEFCFDNRRL
jgi:hypothetical protein